MTKYTTNTFLDIRPNVPAAAVRIRVRWNKSKNVINITIPNYRVNPAKWSSEAGRCKPNTYHNRQPSAAINREIEKYITYINEAFEHYDKQHRTPSTEELRTFINNSINGISSEGMYTLREAMDKFYEQHRNSISNSSANIIRYSLDIINEWNGDILLGEITYDTSANLYSYLVEKKYKNSSISLIMRHYRATLAWANKNNLYNGDGRDYIPNCRGVSSFNQDIIYFTIDEVKQLLATPLTGKKAQVRDMICLSCFTGLRWSDVSTLRWSNITDTHINILMHKTADTVAIDLNTHSRCILDRQPHTSEFIFDNCAYSAKATYYIKSICKSLKFDTLITRVRYCGTQRLELTAPKWQLVSTHTGRKTFVVTALTLGINPDIIMRWTGHSSYDCLRPYIRIVDATKADSMKRFDNLDI